MSWTLKQIKDKVKADLDLEEETFITDDEMNGYVNAAIDEAEAEIHTLYEDYFLTSANISVTSGTAKYSLPSDIYANKIRQVLFNNNSERYEVKRIRRLETTVNVPENEAYRYLIINSATNGTQAQFYPTIRDTSATDVKVFYLRGAKTLVDDSDVTDIPEFASFLIKYVKVKVMDKEKNPSLELAVSDQEAERARMITTLTNMVDDENTEVIADMTFYDDFYRWEGF